MVSRSVVAFILNDPISDYFTAMVTDGWVRVGLKGYCMYDFPPEHPLYHEAVNLNWDTVEDFFDAQYAKYSIYSLTD